MKRDFSLPTAGRHPGRRTPIELMMTPMIDVIFLLLIFFLTSSSFRVAELYLPSSVSKASPPQGTGSDPPIDPTEDALDQIVIKLDVAGTAIRATLNGAPVNDISQLPERLRALAAVRADVPVVIDPDDRVVAQQWISIYDAARQSGLARVYLATR